jgi:hypothetical protein
VKLVSVLRSKRTRLAAKRPNKNKNFRVVPEPEPAIDSERITLLNGNATLDLADVEWSALLPVPKQEVMIVRPGFGYTIDFMTGPAAEALFPPGWAKQRALTKPPQG